MPQDTQPAPADDPEVAEVARGLVRHLGWPEDTAAKDAAEIVAADRNERSRNPR